MSNHGGRISFTGGGALPPVDETTGEILATLEDTRTITPDEAKALRAPFPAKAIGQLPKPIRKDATKGNCAECGGWHGLPAVHLDYVGHAAVTDRLLSVDPSWTWEPFALDPAGLPALDRDGNLWVRLSVCGVTRPGVGDGASMKERIGDAIRNAAMRFGVALDLWAKEDLHDTRQGTDNGSAVARPARKRKPKADSDDVDVPTAAQTRKAMALFTEVGVGDRPSRLEFTSAVLNRDVESWTDVTGDEARLVIDALLAEAGTEPAG